MTCTQCLGSGAWLTSKSTHSANRLIVEPFAVKQCPLCDGTGEQRRVWPFSCGTEMADWKHKNCHRCQNGYDERSEEWRCSIERAIDEGYMGNGTIPIDLARRAGLDELHAGDCKEKELK